MRDDRSSRRTRRKPSAIGASRARDAATRRREPFARSTDGRPSVSGSAHKARVNQPSRGSFAATRRRERRERARGGPARTNRRAKKTAKTAHLPPARLTPARLTPRVVRSPSWARRRRARRCARASSTPAFPSSWPADGARLPRRGGVAPRGDARQARRDARAVAKARRRARRSRNRREGRRLRRVLAPAWAPGVRARDARDAARRGTGAAAAHARARASARRGGGGRGRRVRGWPNKNKSKSEYREYRHAPWRASRRDDESDARECVRAASPRAAGRDRAAFGGSLLVLNLNAATQRGAHRNFATLVAGVGVSFAQAATRGDPVDAEDGKMRVAVAAADVVAYEKKREARRRRGGGASVPSLRPTGAACSARKGEGRVKGCLVELDRVLRAFGDAKDRLVVGEHPAARRGGSRRRRRRRRADGRETRRTRGRPRGFRRRRSRR